MSLGGTKLNPLPLHCLHSDFTTQLKPFLLGYQNSCIANTGPTWRPYSSWHLDTLLIIFPSQNILLLVSVTPAVSISLLLLKLWCASLFFSFHPQMLVYLRALLGILCTMSLWWLSPHLQFRHFLSHGHFFYPHIGPSCSRHFTPTP